MAASERWGIERWRRAAEAARAIMGKEKAESDPLAWWCATELIYHVGETPSARVKRG